MLCLAVSCLAAIAAEPPIPRAGNERTRMDPVITSVAAIGVTVSDLDRSIMFYTQTLGFTLESTAVGQAASIGVAASAESVRTAMLRLGGERIELIDFVNDVGRPIPQDSRSNDQWFQHIAIVVSDMSAAHRRLVQAGVEPVSAGPQRLPDWNPNAGGIEAFYFKDPDRHVLEIIRFPEGKGDSRWHRPLAEPAGAPLFLGIDHTAIVTTDTERDLLFYTGHLGLHIAGASENHGPEQEALNSIAGAHLLITTLKADSGPGIELLEYVSPGPGRAAPADTSAADHWHWHITMTATPGIVETLERGGARRPDTGLAWPLLVRDGTGHALRFVPAAR